MTIYVLGNKTPKIAGSAWVAPDANVIGNVELNEKVSVWFGGILRGDNELIEIGAGSNIQENTVMHTDLGFPLRIGANCTIGHKVMLHGCEVGDNSLIGMGAIVLNGAKIGSNCLIGAGALITENKIIPDGSLVVGAPGKIIRSLSDKEIMALEQSALHYQQNAARFMDDLKGLTKLERDATTFIRPVGFPKSASRPVVTPLSPSVVYASDSPDMLDDQYDGKLSGFTYAREGHPNGQALSEILDRLEAAENGIVTGSGMAAVTSAVMATLSGGDHIIAGDQLYGRSLRLMHEELPRLCISATLANASCSQDIARAINPNTKMVLIEGISNPTLRVADINGISAICKDAGILLAVDNTFTTPKAFQPLKHGADIVIHSVTKLLAGHSDVTLGYVAAKDPAINKRIYDFAVTTGLTASPFDCWLAERGLLTFDLRFEKAQTTAEELANALATHPKIGRVLYPMRADHPDQALAKTHFAANGCNMVSFELTDKTRAAANQFTKCLDGIAFAPTLGDVGTTLSHPVSSSHRSMEEADRTRNGISEGFFRISVGLEDPEELISAFKKALDQL